MAIEIRDLEALAEYKRLGELQSVHERRLPELETEALRAGWEAYEKVGGEKLKRHWAMKDKAEAAPHDERWRLETQADEYHTQYIMPMRQALLDARNQAQASVMARRTIENNAARRYANQCRLIWEEYAC